MLGPCAKQIVKARIVALDGSEYLGENNCLNAQSVCPRGDLPSGQGYELCQSICQQTGHAEVNAIKAAGIAANGATLFLSGHTYACSSCKSAADAAGIVEIIIV
jgi:deoxycytidylate deaminase